MNDGLIICKHCGGDCCYAVENSPTIKTYSCFSCGFTTNSLMKDGEEFYNQQLEVLPELYKDVIFTDENELKWMPTTINLPQQGMVFIHGTNKENWEWVSVLSIPILDEEKEKYKNKNGSYNDFRMDMTTMKHFGKNGFMDALEYIGILPK